MRGSDWFKIKIHYACIGWIIEFGSGLRDAVRSPVTFQDDVMQSILWRVHCGYTLRPLTRFTFTLMRNYRSRFLRGPSRIPTSTFWYSTDYCSYILFCANSKPLLKQRFKICINLLWSLLAYWAWQVSSQNERDVSVVLPADYRKSAPNNRFFSYGA